MDINTTSSVTVLREIKSATLSADMLRALGLTAVKNFIDPNGTASFGEQDATANPDGTITVTVAVETSVPATAPAPAAPVATAAASIPMSIGVPPTA